MDYVNENHQKQDPYTQAELSSACNPTPVGSMHDYLNPMCTTNYMGFSHVIGTLPAWVRITAIISFAAVAAT